jgi:hypothetical protein
VDRSGGIVSKIKLSRHIHPRFLLNQQPSTIQVFLSYITCHQGIQVSQKNIHQDDFDHAYHSKRNKPDHLFFSTTFGAQVTVQISNVAHQYVKSVEDEVFHIQKFQDIDISEFGKVSKLDALILTHEVESGNTIFQAFDLVVSTNVVIHFKVILGLIVA